METPFSRSRRATSKRRFVSFGVSAAVGSSMMRTFTSHMSALAISIICCWPTESVSIAARTGIATPRSASAASQRASIAALSRTPKRPTSSRPMNMFSSTVRSYMTLSS